MSVKQMNKIYIFFLWKKSIDQELIDNGFLKHYLVINYCLLVCHDTKSRMIKRRDITVTMVIK